MSKFPKGFNKTGLLIAVDQFNADFDQKLKLKSKSVQSMCDDLSALILTLDQENFRNTGDISMLETFTAFNIISGFIAADDVSEGLMEAFRSHGSDTVLSASPVVFVEAKDETPPWAELEAKLADNPDMKKKKRKKIQAEIDALKEADEKSRVTWEDDEIDQEAADAEEKRLAEEAAKEEKKKEKKKKDAEPSPAELALATMEQELASGELKKKKAKKLQKKIDALKAEIASAKKTTKPKAKKNTGPGVIATIQAIITEAKKGMTVEQIADELASRIPDRERDKMMKTVRAQLVCREAPCRMEKEKNVVITVKGEGVDRKFLIK